MPTIITKGAASAQGFGAFASLGANYFIGLLAPASFVVAGYGITTDSSNNIYVCGYDGSSENGNIVLYKYNSSGVLQWQKQISNAATDQGFGVTVDTSSNIYICGSIDISGNSDMFLAKYDSSGNIQWQKRLYGTSTNDVANSIKTDSSGNVYICGYSPTTNLDITLAKYNSSGTLQWQRKLYGSLYSIAYGITIDTSNNVYITGVGYFLTSGFNQNKIVVAKYDTTGSLVWQNKLGPTTNNSNETGNGVATDSSGNVYLACQATPAAGSIFQIAKYDSSGILQWQRSLGTSGDNTCKSVATDSSGNVYFAGYILDGSNYCSVIAKYDSSGTLQWQRKLTCSYSGTANNNFAFSIYVDSANNLCICGYANGNGIGRSMVLKLPNDGSKTGTYTVGSMTFVYAASTFTDAATSYTNTAISYTNATALLTDAATTLTSSNSSFTSTVTQI